MPTYVFKCGACDRPTEVVSPMSERPEVATCPACGALAYRDFQAELGVRHGEPDDWITWSLGCDPLSVPVFNRDYADLGVKFDAKGHAHVPGRNVQKYLDRRGFHRDRGKNDDPN